MPGSFAIVPALLDGDDLQAGNALVSGGTQLATLIGPAIGGALVALVGPASGVRGRRGLVRRLGADAGRAARRQRVAGPAAGACRSRMRRVCRRPGRR